MNNHAEMAKIYGRASNFNQLVKIDKKIRNDVTDFLHLTKKIIDLFRVSENLNRADGYITVTLGSIFSHTTLERIDDTLVDELQYLKERGFTIKIDGLEDDDLGGGILIPDNIDENDIDTLVRIYWDTTKGSSNVEEIPYFPARTLNKFVDFNYWYNPNTFSCTTINDFMAYRDNLADLIDISIYGEVWDALNSAVYDNKKDVDVDFAKMDTFPIELLYMAFSGFSIRCVYTANTQTGVVTTDSTGFDKYIIAGW